MFIISTFNWCSALVFLFTAFFLHVLVLVHWQIDHKKHFQQRHIWFMSRMGSWYWFFFSLWNKKSKRKQNYMSPLFSKPGNAVTHFRSAFILNYSTCSFVFWKVFLPYSYCHVFTGGREQEEELGGTTYEEKGILGKESTVWEVCMVAVIRVGHKRVRSGTKTRRRSKARKQSSAVWGLYLYG